MEVTVEITKERYIKSVKTLLVYTYKRYLLILLGISLLLSAIQNRDAPHFFKSFWSTAFSVFIALVLVSFISSFLKTRKKFKAATQHLGDKTYLQVFTLGDDGINIKTEQADTFYRWFEIKRVYLNAGYILIGVSNKSTYGIPVSSFTVPGQKDEFLLTVQNNIKNTNITATKYTRPSYYWGLLGLIPVVGAINGLLMVVSGISKYKDTRYTLIGIAGILVTAATFISIIYYANGSSFSNYDRLFRRGFADMSQKDVNSLVKEVEFYKMQNGVYPDSLQQLVKKDQFIPIYDPLLGDKKGNYYNYRKIGLKYTLFSSGIDETPGTSDDIYPTVDTSRTGLVINRK